MPKLKKWCHAFNNRNMEAPPYRKHSQPQTLLQVQVTLEHWLTEQLPLRINTGVQLEFSTR